jgi:hypothetical protein
MTARLAATALALALATLAGCAAPREGAAQGAAADRPGGPSGPSPEEGRVVLLRFALAVRAGRWAAAWPLLSDRWRAATSPGRLAADYRAAGPVAREAAERVAALLEGGASLSASPGVLRLEVGPGRAARLVREPAGWRVEALE